MNNSAKKGFTLIEALVYIAVLSIILVAVVSFLNWIIETGTKIKATRSVIDNARTAINAMSYEIREADEIYFPVSGSEQLSLVVDHDLPADESYSYVDFYLCGSGNDVLCYKKESEDPVALTSERVQVDSLTFNYVASSSVEILLEISYRNPNNRSEYEASINLVSVSSLRSY